MWMFKRHGCLLPRNVRRQNDSVRRMRRGFGLMSKRKNAGVAIRIRYGDLFDYLRTALDRRPTPQEFDEFKAWINRDVSQWLTDNAKSFIQDRAELPKTPPHEMCTCGHSRSRHLDVDEDGDGLGRCCVHFCSCEKFEKAAK